MAVPDSAIVALWWHYEELAMHFNGLIMQFRVQVLGGAGAIGTLAGYLINSGKIDDEQQRERLRAVVAAGLWVLIASAALLDVFYYRQLLEGAVNAIIDFERQHPEIQISTEIKRTVGRGVDVIWVVYTLLLATLGTFALRSYWKSRQPANRPSAHRQRDQRSAAGAIYARLFRL
jgi:hypothetical protein